MRKIGLAEVLQCSSIYSRGARPLITHSATPCVVGTPRRFAIACVERKFDFLPRRLVDKEPFLRYIKQGHPTRYSTIETVALSGQPQNTFIIIINYWCS